MKNITNKTTTNKIYNITSVPVPGGVRKVTVSESFGHVLNE